MSVVRCVEVRCDGRAGVSECPDSVAWSDYGTARALRERMRAAGWRVNAGPSASRDVCPACSTLRGSAEERSDDPSNPPKIAEVS